MFGQMRKKVLWACVTLGLSAFAICALFYNGGFSFDAGSAKVWDVKNGIVVTFRRTDAILFMFLQTVFLRKRLCSCLGRLKFQGFGKADYGHAVFAAHFFQGFYQI